MGNAKGEVIETPTQEMAFKAVIRTDEEIIQERFFAVRSEAEAYIVNALKGLTARTTDQSALRLD